MTLLSRLPAWLTVPLAYFVVAVTTLTTTRYGGGVAFVWVAGSILLTHLHVSRRPFDWPVLIGCAVASAAATALFGVGPAAALPLAAINIAETVTIALGLDLLRRRRKRLSPLAATGGFALAAGGVAPALGAIAGAAVASRVSGTPYLTNLVAWYSGHALGTVIVAPILIGFARGEVGRWLRDAAPRARLEAAGLLGFMATTAWLVFDQSRYPILFLPLLPLMVATFRLGRMGAGLSMLVLTVIAGVFTLRGVGPIALVDAPIGDRMLFLQLYLGIASMLALPAAAELHRRAAITLKLRESEARYRILAENTSDVVMNLTPSGRIRYVSPAVERIAGYRPDELVGRLSQELLHDEDVPTLVETHLAALAAPGRDFRIEYRARHRSGALIWCETHTRAITDADGVVVGAVSAIREIGHRKSLEQSLTEAAHTDPLTGIANRRAFDLALAARIADEGRGGRGCIAVLDVDFFKRVNDTHGHPVGDRVLQAVAAAARATLRDGDLVARLGGEEFAVILTGAGVEEARIVCERLRQAVAEIRTPNETGGVVRVTVSAGLAPIVAGSDVAGLLRTADEALYAAKREGRDRLVLAA